MGLTDVDSCNIEDKHDGTNPSLSSVFSYIPCYGEDTSKENLEMRIKQVKENEFQRIDLYIDEQSHISLQKKSQNSYLILTYF